MFLLDRRKILIVGIPRSGTHFLFETIKKEMPDDYISISEPFNLETLALRNFGGDLSDTQNLRQACEYVISRIIRYDHVILKCNTEEFERLRELDLFDQANFEQDYHKILLLRRDLVEHILSHAVALTTHEFKDYTYTEVELNQEVVDQSIQDIVTDLDRILASKVMPSYDQIVFYEDVVHHAQTYGYTYDNLKQAPSKADAVSNYDAWKDYILEQLEDTQLPKNFTVEAGQLKDYVIRMTT